MLFGNWRLFCLGFKVLIPWGVKKNDLNFSDIFNAFSWIKISIFWLKFQFFICYQWSNWQEVNIGSANGSELNGWQAVIWTVFSPMLRWSNVLIVLHTGTIGPTAHWSHSPILQSYISLFRTPFGPRPIHWSCVPLVLHMGTHMVYVGSLLINRPTAHLPHTLERICCKVHWSHDPLVL